jgi:hypothetical protein
MVKIFPKKIVRVWIKYLHNSSLEAEVVLSLLEQDIELREMNDLVKVFWEGHLQRLRRYGTLQDKDEGFAAGFQGQG